MSGFGLTLWLPLMLLLFLLPRPDFHRLWWREGRAANALADALARAVHEEIAPETLAPWVPQDLGGLSAVFRYALQAEGMEGRVADLAAQWVRAGLGRDPAPELAPAVAQTLRGPEGELLRAFLWERLPPCPGTGSLACIPQDPDARGELGRAQQRWWAETSEALIAWSGRVALPTGRWASLAGLGWVGLLSAALGIAGTLALARGAGRWLLLGLPLMVAGALVVALGWGLTQMGMVEAGLVRALEGAWTPAALRVALALGPRAARAIGHALLLVGAGSLGSSGVLVACAAPAGWPRSALGVASLLLLGAIGLTLPGSALLPPLPSPTQPLPATPTPWPTATVTPTPSPTPLYWPVQPGTPVPTPLPGAAGPLERLGCYALEPQPVLALALSDAALVSVQADAVVRYRLPGLYPQQRARSLMAARLAAASDRWIVLAEDHRLRVWNALDLAPHPAGALAASAPLRAAALWPAALRPAQSGATEAHAVVALETGQLWVFRLSTGGLAALVETRSESPITALAVHPEQPWALLGHADGSLALWDWRAARRLAWDAGEGAAVWAAAFSPDGGSAAVVDAARGVMLRDGAGLQVLARGALPSAPSSNLVWRGEYLLLGSAEGELLIVDGALSVGRLAALQGAITAVGASPAGYVAVAGVDGAVCVLGTVMNAWMEIP